MNEAKLAPNARNFVRVGDVVRCKEHPHLHGSFLARITRIDTDDEGIAVTVHVVGGRGYQPNRETHNQSGVCEHRAFRAERIRRTAQTRWES